MRYIKIFLFSLALIMSSLTYAREIPEMNYRLYSINDGIQKIIANTLRKMPSNANIGVVIQSMQTKKILYRKNANHLFTPASIQKILTAVAALDYLKPSYIFHTQLRSKGKIINHELKANLFIKFTGDSELTDTDFKKLFKKLHNKGVNKITGKIFIDNTDYGTVPYPPGWIWDDLSYSFAAPLNTIIIDRNYYVLKLQPPKKNEKQPSIKTDLPDGVATFTNAITVVDNPKKNCPLRIYSNANNHYTLKGCFYRRWGTQSRKLAIRNILSYTKALVQQALQKNKIHYAGEITVRKLPKGTKVLVQHNSPPLSQIIKHMLKESDNLTTNALLKKLGKNYYHGRGTWKNGLRALKQLLAKPVSIDFTTNLINDGAGLSRYNLLTPMQISKVLYFAYHKKLIKKAFMNALPIAGKDGTMEYRLTRQKGQRILAKTGSMTGVSSLAGYIKSKRNGVLSFVIMVNGFVKPKRPYIVMEDKICKLLVNAETYTERKSAGG